MAIERDGEGLEFPWLLAFGITVPAAVAIARAPARPPPEPPTLPAPGPAPLPPPAPPPEAPPAPAPGPVLQPVFQPEPEPVFQPRLPTTGFVQQPVPEPVMQRRVEAAVHEAAVTAAKAQQVERVAPAIEQTARVLTKSATVEQAVRGSQQVQAAVKLASKPPAPAEVARIEKKLREQVNSYAKKGATPAQLERLAKKKVAELQATAQRTLDKAVKPVAKTVKQVEAAAKKLPTPVRKELEKATAPIRREAVKAVKSVASDAAKEVGLDQAKAIAGDTLRKMNLPNVPVALPTKLTPEGIKDAAYSSGKQYVEGLMQSTIGFSVPLPKKLTVKEIERSLTGLLPSDAKEAIERGIDIGTQIAASAISSALTGATIGSVIPGLGTVIGIGVALGVNALKGAIKKAFTEKHAAQQRCKSEDKYKVTLPKLSPIELLPWIAQKRFDMSKAIAEQQKKTQCGLTPYDSGLSQLGHDLFPIVKATIPVLGLEQINRYLPIYERAPRKTWYWDKGRIQPGGAIVGGTKKILYGEVTGTGQEIGASITLLRARKVKLDHMISQLSRIEKLQPSELAPLRFDVVTELMNAAAQYQITQSAESKKWLSQLGGFMQRIEKREGADFNEMKRRYEQDKATEARLQAQGKTGVVKGII